MRRERIEERGKRGVGERQVQLGEKKGRKERDRREGK